MFHECWIGDKEYNCCDLFFQHYIMLRGRCFRMHSANQTSPGIYGELYLGIKNLPSLSTAGGMQVGTVYQYQYYLASNIILHGNSRI